jgi:hypothetical protein
MSVILNTNVCHPERSEGSASLNARAVILNTNVCHPERPVLALLPGSEGSASLNAEAVILNGVKDLPP